MSNCKDFPVVYGTCQGLLKYAVALALLSPITMTITRSLTADAEVDVPPGDFFMLWQFHLLQIWKSMGMAEDLQEFPHWHFPRENLPGST